MKDYKKDFPIFATHPNLVYLDSGNTSQKPKQVITAIDDFYQSYNANIHRALYEIAERATQGVEETRKKVAKFINAKDPSEIIFTKNTTEGINLLAYSWGEENLEKGDTIVSTVMEHHANFVPWQQLAVKQNAEFKVIDITDGGTLDVEYSVSSIKYAKLLAITHVSNVLGTINPIKEIIKKVKKVNPDILVLVDASQSVPHMKVDVQDLGCDFLVFTGHKIFAETGVGVLYGKKELLEKIPPFLFGGDMIKEVAIEKTTFADVPHKFEAGTINIAGIISLGAAIDYIDSIGMDVITNHEKDLTRYTYEQLEKIPGITIHGPKELDNRSGIISFSHEDIHAHDIAQLLGESEICVRAGHHCAMPLHTRLGTHATTRVSLHIYNDEKDIDTLVGKLKEIIKIFAK